MTPRELTYGINWRNFTTTLRYGRAQARCECDGRCGKHHGSFLDSRCRNRHNRPTRDMHGLAKLQAAHLCDCQPKCQDPQHIMMMCQTCHLRFDMRKNLEKRRKARVSRIFNQPPNSPEGEL